MQRLTSLGQGRDAEGSPLLYTSSILMIWLGIVQCWATGDKECISGGLNESAHHRLRHLNAWSPVGATVQED